MFRKLVSNLSFSPALVGQLGFYARRLRKEEVTRKAGLIITVLALAFQSLAVFSPPDAANASSPADFIPGGVSGKQDFINHYNNNTGRIKGLLSSLGITQSEVASMHVDKIRAKEVGGKYNFSRTSLYSYGQGQRSYSFNGNTVFYRPLALTQTNPPHKVLVGHSAVFGWFAIKMDCGNLITNHPPQAANPEAACTNLSVTPLPSRTQFRFNAKASAKDGAKIKKYEYTVRNAANKVVSTVPHASTEKQDSIVYNQTKPGKYTVRLTVYTSEGKKTNSNCVGKFSVPEPTKPAAACTNLQARVIGRNTVTLVGQASVANGATVSRYTFVVKNKAGQIIKTIPVNSNKLSVNTESFVLDPAGEYTASLTVQSSVGPVTDPTDCVAPISIKPAAVCPINPQLPPNSPDCQPCPDNPDIWIKDENCSAEVISRKTAINTTRGNVEAAKTIARAGDRITYTVEVENVGYAPTTVTMKEELRDVLQYAELVDTGNGVFNSTSNELVWKDVKVESKSKQSRTFVVRVRNPVPTTNTGTSDASSYDCVMTNTFGNSIDVKVQCPVEKVIVEQTVAELPKTGPGENLLFAGVLLAIVTYFYARSRQLGKEVRLVRRNINAGTI